MGLSHRIENRKLATSLPQFCATFDAISLNDTFYTTGVLGPRTVYAWDILWPGATYIWGVYFGLGRVVSRDIK